eukprot:3446550-Prymnesium_polylepis.1
MGNSKARWATARPDGQHNRALQQGQSTCDHGPTGQPVHRHVPGPWPGVVRPLCRSYGSYQDKPWRL